jgi:hypothetical protein
VSDWFAMVVFAGCVIGTFGLMKLCSALMPSAIAANKSNADAGVAGSKEGSR